MIKWMSDLPTWVSPASDLVGLLADARLTHLRPDAAARVALVTAYAECREPLPIKP
jgi:hypothetical protein